MKRRNIISDMSIVCIRSRFISIQILNRNFQNKTSQNKNSRLKKKNWNDKIYMFAENYLYLVYYYVVHVIELLYLLNMIYVFSDMLFDLYQMDRFHNFQLLTNINYSSSVGMKWSQKQHIVFCSGKGLRMVVVSVIMNESLE